MEEDLVLFLAVFTLRPSGVVLGSFPRVSTSRAAHTQHTSTLFNSRRLFKVSFEVRIEQGAYTYGHWVGRTGLPVRSAVLETHAGQLVVWCVNTCEPWLL